MKSARDLAQQLAEPLGAVLSVCQCAKEWGVVSPLRAGTDGILFGLRT